MEARPDAATWMMTSCLPLLVFHHGHPDGQEDNEEDDEMLMYSISKQSLHTDMKRGLLLAAGGNDNSGSSMCWATPQGWMLHVALQVHDDAAAAAADDDTAAVSSAWLWNPLTGDKLPLPDIIVEEEDEEHQIPYDCKCLLSHKDPAHPGCVAVLFSCSTPDLWYCRITVDDETRSNWGWRHYSYDIGNYGLPAAYHPPTKKVISAVAASFQGRFYFINSTTDMCAIDFACSKHDDDGGDPAFHYFDAEMPDFPEPDEGMTMGFAVAAVRLLDCDGELFLVDVSLAGVDLQDIAAVRVYKMDLSSSGEPPRWRRTRDVGDAVFLLDGTGLATSCSASLHGLKRNQVYVMRNLVEDDADLCVFDLESECQEITRVHHRDGLPLCRKPFWIVPPP